jgi:hypothetical protein
VGGDGGKDRELHEGICWLEGVRGEIGGVVLSRLPIPEEFS